LFQKVNKTFRSTPNLLANIVPSSLFLICPPFRVLGGGSFFNILSRIISRILHTMSQRLDCLLSLLGDKLNVRRCKCKVDVTLHLHLRTSTYIYVELHCTFIITNISTADMDFSQFIQITRMSFVLEMTA